MKTKLNHLLKNYWLYATLAFVLVYVLLQSFLFRRTTRTVELSVQENLSHAVRRIKDSLDMVDNFLYESLFNGSQTLPSILYHELTTETDPIELTVAKNTAIAAIENLVTWSDSVEFLLLYAPREPFGADAHRDKTLKTGGRRGSGYVAETDEGFWIESGRDDTYPLRQAVKVTLLAPTSTGTGDGSALTELAAKGPNNRYLLFSNGSERRILRTLNLEGCTIIAGISNEALLAKLEQSRFTSTSLAFASDAAGNVICMTSSAHTAAPQAPAKSSTSGSSPSTSSGNGILPFPTDSAKNYVKWGGTAYFFTRTYSPTTGIVFGMLTPRRAVLSELTVTIGVFVTMMLAITLFVQLFYRTVNRHVVRPIEDITQTMNRAAHGNALPDSDDRAAPDQSSSPDHEGDNTPENREAPLSPDSYTVEELAFLVETYNRMMSQIEQLTAEKYEAELEAQRASLQYLQLQIRPHFYANVLNLVNILAGQHDYEKITKLTAAIVTYSRYRFQDPVELVELKKEMEHVAAYRDIQAIRYGGNIVFTFDVSHRAETALIPPFIIQNFIENSVKHAYCESAVLVISVSAHVDQNRDTLMVTIRDNGPGFSREVLERPNDKKSDEGHLGLTNVYLRLRYIFEENATMTLKNDGGAVVELRVPYISPDVDALE